MKFDSQPNFLMQLNKILLRGPNWVGDAVLAIPAMKAIRTIFPEAEITVLVRPWVAGIFTSASFVDRVWTEPRPATLGEWLRLARGIREKHFDMALLFPNSFESAAMVFCSRVPKRIGYATDARGWLLTNSIHVSRGKRHQVDYYLDLVSAVSANVDRPSIEISASPEEKDQARKLLTSAGIGRHERFLILNPGAAYGSAKRWEEDQFAATADALSQEFGMHVVIIGSETERSIAEAVSTRMSGPAVILNGKTSLETLIGLISESSLIITNDSGPMHIAAALGIPTVAIFGPTDDSVTSPCGPRTRVVKEPVDCSPCMLRECPIDHRCMTRVRADAVCRAAREVMSG